MKGPETGSALCAGGTGGPGSSAGFGFFSGVKLGKKPIRDPFRKKLSS